MNGSHVFATTTTRRTTLTDQITDCTSFTSCCLRARPQKTPVSDSPPSPSTMKTVMRTLLCLALVTSTYANVIGIDLGSENMKVGLVSPGKFDIGK